LFIYLCWYNIGTTNVATHCVLKQQPDPQYRLNSTFLVPCAGLSRNWIPLSQILPGPLEPHVCQRPTWGFVLRTIITQDLTHLETTVKGSARTKCSIPSLPSSRSFRAVRIIKELSSLDATNCSRRKAWATNNTSACRSAE